MKSGHAIRRALLGQCASMDGRNAAASRLLALILAETSQGTDSEARISPLLSHVTLNHPAPEIVLRKEAHVTDVPPCTIAIDDGKIVTV